MSGKKALILIAEGSEEIEAVTPMDVLRRAGVNETKPKLDVMVYSFKGK